MSQDEIIQKLVQETMMQRVMIRSLVAMLAAHLHPGSPQEALDKMSSEWVEMYQEMRLPILAEMAEDFGLPLAPRIQADLMPAEFVSWLRRETGDPEF